MKNKNTFSLLFLGLCIGIGAIFCLADTPIFAPGNSTLSIQSGTTATANFFTETNAFNPAFSVAPAVFVKAINATAPTTDILVSVTTSNFVWTTSSTNMSNGWLAVGPR